jgi:signal transduction histidine kinase
MKKSFKTPDFEWLDKAYFSNEKQVISLRKGDELLLQGQFNDRLYLVKKGLLIGYAEDDKGYRYEVFRANPRMFIGVYSSFSKTFPSIATVVAEKNSELAYIDQTQSVVSSSKAGSLAEEFMPMVVTELLYRQQWMQDMAIEKEVTIKHLMQSEKLASLGQMAAGIAHELNNAIAVLKRNTEWIKEQLLKLWQEFRPEEYLLFKQGVLRGRNLSSMQTRKRSRELQKQYSMESESADYLAQMDFTHEDINLLSKKTRKNIKELFSFWEMGSTIHDMLTATSHSTHVLNSVKSLGAERSFRQSNVNLNDSITEALSLLHNNLKRITIKTNLKPLPLIEANKGEFVQVWANILKNAFDSLILADVQRPVIWIFSELYNDSIVIKIQDNGPGIPQNIVSKIFEPKFTTKTNGTSFGLGLGLAIVQRIIHSYDGTVSVKSEPGKTIFIIKIPAGVKNAET